MSYSSPARLVSQVLFRVQQISNLGKITSGDPKLMMTSQFPQRSQYRIFPDSRLQNEGKERKENELVFFRKLTLLESKLSCCFLLLSFLEHNNKFKEVPLKKMVAVELVYHISIYFKNKIIITHIGHFVSSFGT